MIYESTLFSIIFQAITSLVDVYGITLPINDNFLILRDLLEVELGVQFIEIIFYIWLIFSINSIKNITIFRYLDWFITTPVMLITLMAYLSISNENIFRLNDFLNSDKDNIIYVIILNAVMLAFGLLAEFVPSCTLVFVGLGFIPFILYFYRIYKEYLNKNTDEVHPFFTKSRLFYYFLVVWSLYGVVAFLPYTLKNIGLNILDLFSKNIFGLMLVIIIAYHSTSDNIVTSLFGNIFKSTK
jgi:bacteriorhodopsin